MASDDHVRSTSVEAGILGVPWTHTTAHDLLQDGAVVTAMAEVESALAGAMADLSMISAEDAHAIERVFRSGSLDLDAIGAAVVDAANPVVQFVALFEQEIERHAPGVSDSLHRGSTSQDILDTALVLLALRATRVLIREIDAATDALVTVVAEHRTRVALTRTMGQPALPGTVGLRVSQWIHGLLDARDRLHDLFIAGFPVSLGGAAGTGAAYGEYARNAGVSMYSLHELTQRFSSRLGMHCPDVPWHSVRTPLFDIVSAYSLASLTFGKVANDVLTSSRPEIGEIVESGPVGTGISSAMPQKSNPVLCAAVLAAARQAPPLALIVEQSIVLDDERGVGAWQAEWQPLRECLRVVLGAAERFHLLTTRLAVNDDAIAENLVRFLPSIVSERVAIAYSGAIGKANAKKALTRALNRRKIDGEDVVRTICDSLTAAGARVTEQAIEALLSPEQYLGEADEVVDAILTRASRRTPLPDRPRDQGIATDRG